MREKLQSIEKRGCPLRFQACVGKAEGMNTKVTNDTKKANTNPS